MLLDARVSLLSLSDSPLSYSYLCTAYLKVLLGCAAARLGGGGLLGTAHMAAVASSSGGSLPLLTAGLQRQQRCCVRAATYFTCPCRVYILDACCAQFGHNVAFDCMRWLYRPPPPLCAAVMRTGASLHGTALGTGKNREQQRTAIWLQSCCHNAARVVCTGPSVCGEPSSVVITTRMGPHLPLYISSLSQFSPAAVTKPSYHIKQSS